MLVCKGFAESDGDIISGQRGDGETDVGFVRFHDGIGHFIKGESNMCYYTEETEASCCGFEMCWIGDGAMLAIGIDVLDCSDVVVDCLVAATCTVTDRTVDASKCNPESD